MGLNLKHDVRIELKHEKEIFRFIRLLIFTYIFAWFFYGVNDYIWNMTLWHIMGYVAPWLAAMPAIVNLIVRKVSFKKIVGEHIGRQIVFGCAIGLLMASVVGIFSVASGITQLTGVQGVEWRKVISAGTIYFFAIGPTEELIYRVSILGSLQEICEKHRWIAPFVANALFALVHLLYRDWMVALNAFVVGCVYTFLAVKKRHNYVLLAASHAMYDFGMELVLVILALILC